MDCDIATAHDAHDGCLGVRGTLLTLDDKLHWPILSKDGERWLCPVDGEPVKLNDMRYWTHSILIKVSND